MVPCYKINDSKLARENLLTNACTKKLRRHFSWMPTTRSPTVYATWWASLNMSRDGGGGQSWGPVQSRPRPCTGTPFPMHSEYLRFRLHLGLSVIGRMAIWWLSPNYHLSDLEKVGWTAEWRFGDKQLQNCHSAVQPTFPKSDEW